MSWAEIERRCAAIGLSTEEFRRRAGIGDDWRRGRITGMRRMVVALVLTAAEVTGEIKDKGAQELARRRSQMEKVG